MNRGLFRADRPSFIPPWAGGGDPSNDGCPVVEDSTQPGGIRVGTGGITIPGDGAGLGANTTARMLGATTGAPTGGKHGLGDTYVEITGGFWVCTIAGNPGTFTFVGSGAELGYFSSTTAVASLSSTTFAAVTGYSKTVTVPAGGRPVYVEIDAGTLELSSAGNVTLDILEDGTSTTGASGQSLTVAINAFFGMRMRVRRTPAAGSHTYSVSYKVSAGSLTISPFAEPYDMAIALR